MIVLQEKDYLVLGGNEYYVTLDKYPEEFGYCLKLWDCKIWNWSYWTTFKYAHVSKEIKFFPSEIEDLISHGFKFYRSGKEIIC
jgi:hypothetical protein